MKAANRLKAIDDQVAGQNDLGDYHDNGLYYSQHQTAEFAYDDNGNLEQDMNRNIGIKYGILHNLPIYIAYRQTGGGGSIATLDVSSSTVDLSDRAASTSYSGSMMNYYTLQGRKMSKKVYNDQHTLTLNESYYDELMLSHRQPARISHADGYVSLDENGEASFYYTLTDHLGNVRSVITPDADGKPQVEQANDYFPFGMSFESRLPYLTKSGSGNNKFKYNSKEEQEMPGKWLDYGARMYDPSVGRWHVQDPVAESYFSYSPYNYVRNNPILRVDKFGKWDVTVHVYNDREQYGYGVAIVTDRNGNEVYRFNVRAEGTAGRNRMQTDADTPLGVYDIPDDNPWLTGVSRQSYGPNARLNMSPESGEIVDSGRDLIRIHGGRQEVYNKKTKQWEPVTNPQLKKTNGCLRAYDADMATFKQITDNLQANDSEETPGQVTITDDLEQEITPASENNMVEVNVTYNVPAEELEYWQNFVNNLLNNNGGQ
jgi:RHS repeat-associated protein